MTRFVRIYDAPQGDPGSRIRVDYDPDDTGAFIVVDENVLPEETNNPDARRVQQIGSVELDNGSTRWLRDTFIALCEHLDAEDGGPDATTTRQPIPRPVAIGPEDTAIIDRALSWYANIGPDDAPRSDIARIRAALTGTVLS